MLHTPVSSDGTTLKTRALAGVFASVTTSRPTRQAKSAALSPAFSCGPTSVTGFPLNVTALGRFCMADVLSREGSSVDIAVRIGTRTCKVKRYDESMEPLETRLKAHAQRSE